MPKKKNSQPKVRSFIAQAAHFRSGSGSHGGSARSRNRKERRQARLDLRKGEW